MKIFRRLTIFMLSSMSLSAALSQQGSAISNREASLREYIKDIYADDGEVPAYTNVFFDLNGDGKQEAVVYLADPDWCGSGGCDMLVLEPIGSSYKLITDIGITRPPIIALKRSSHGWRHLAVFVAGGGILPGYEAELPFDGTKYAENPSVAPARQMTEEPDGDVLIGQ